MVVLFRCWVLFVSWVKFLGKKLINRIESLTQRGPKKEHITLSLFSGCQAQNKFR